MQWKFFWIYFIRSLIFVFIFVIAFIFVFNPYGNLPSLGGNHYVPQSSNQRFSYPQIARNKKFDSVVIGTSTSRLLDPDNLNTLYQSNFANLAMNSARAYEQMKILDVFIKSRDTIKTVVIGLDVVWCDKDIPLEKYTFREFPEWLYASERIFDIFNMLNFDAIEIAGRQALFSLGKREGKYRENGYKNFLPDDSEYDIERARTHLYANSHNENKIFPLDSEKDLLDKKKNWIYPAHKILRKALSDLPDETKKVLFFVPYHHVNQPVKGTEEWHRYHQCKVNIKKLVSEYKNIDLIDFMIPSEVTMNDYNYWDPLHYRVNVSQEILDSLQEVHQGKKQQRKNYALLRKVGSG